jgi:hypothetical protein
MTSPKLTIIEIIERYPAEWALLSSQQRTFVIELIGSDANGRYNAVAATKVAYPKVKTPVAWASRLIQNRRVKKVITLHLGLTDTQVLLGDVKSLLKRSKRKHANLELLVPYWSRACAALEALVAREQSNA